MKTTLLLQWFLHPLASAAFSYLPLYHTRHSTRTRTVLQQSTVLDKEITKATDSNTFLPQRFEQPHDDLQIFPMDMIVGHNDVKQAIMISAVSGESLILAGPTGTCKSALIRSIQNLLPTVPVVHIPSTVSQDALTGSIDLESSMETGVPKFQPGLLEKAHGAVVILDDVNLMDVTSGSVLFSALSDRFVHVERESLSVEYPCVPKVVLATYNDDYEEMNAHFLDRFSMQVLVSDEFSIADRLQVVENWEAYSEKDSRALLPASHKNAIRRHQIEFARERLQDVQIPHDAVDYLATMATAFDCEGQRAEISAIGVAKALAALAHRSSIEQVDLEEAVRLCIVPRARVIPVAAEEETQEAPAERRRKPDQIIQEPPPSSGEDTSPEDFEQESEQEMDQEMQIDEDSGQENETEPETLEIPEEMFFGVDTSVRMDPALLAFAQKFRQRKGRGGKRKPSFNIERGKFVKSVFPIQERRGRLAVGATLRAAAPYQLRRRLRVSSSTRVRIAKDDFRIQLLKKKTGSLIIFVVDSSGSMALNRMSAAKGAAMTMLNEAYKSRDKVALISFHGESAETLVPPTKSMALARSRLEAMPCGSKTPLAHALAKAVTIGMNTMKVKRDASKVIIVLVSDCRPNVPLCISLGEHDPLEAKKSERRQFMKDEVLQIARSIGAIHDFDLLVVDTEDKFVCTGVGIELARHAGGNYYHLGGGSASHETILSAIRHA